LDVLEVLLTIGAVVASIPFGAGIAGLVVLAVTSTPPGDEPVAYLVGAAVLAGLGLAMLAFALYRQRERGAQSAPPERFGANS
jgi:hypothetical protein